MSTGLKITDETLEDRLAYDEIFVEYFNAFLALPVRALTPYKKLNTEVKRVSYMYISMHGSCARISGKSCERYKACDRSVRHLKI